MKPMFFASLLFALVALGCASGDSNSPTATAIIIGPTRAATATGAASPTSAPPSPPATKTAGTTPAPSPSASPANTSPTAAATAIPSTAASQVATPAPQPTAPPQARSISLSIRALDNKFDRQSVRVSVGTTITATLQNDDAGIDHNLTFGLPGLAHGETCTGPCSATQTFKADKAGSFYFLCTIHDMVGTFVVDP